MSEVFADAVVVKWVEDNRFPPAAEDDNVLVISVPTEASADAFGPVRWNSAVAGLFELKTLHVPAQDSLNDTTLAIELPGFGPAVLFSGKNIDLKNPTPIGVSIPGAAVGGTVKFSPLNGKIKLDWKVDVPWFGSLDDGRDLFPTDRSSAFFANKVESLKIIPDSEVSAIAQASLSEFTVVKDSSGKERIIFEASEEDTDEQAVAAAFIHDNVGAGDPVVALPVSFGLKSEGNTIDIGFLGIFQLVGTVLPSAMSISAILYVKIPFVGRVKIVELKGSLLTGVSVSVNLVLVTGSVVVSAKKNASGKHDLYINLKLKIKFVKDFNTGDIKIWGLPF